MAAPVAGWPYVSIVAIVLFFVLHWQLSVLLQSFFQHRYCAHRQFSMSPRWERFFHVLTWAVQGSSYLNPRAYAVMHRMHHAFSDTEKDPHSPVQQKSFFAMMWRTKVQYSDLKERKVAPEPRFAGGYPEWKLIDDTLGGWTASIAWCGVYTLYYLAFATHAWMYLLLPIHWVMGPVHGAIVNWCGHKYGYRNYDSDDHSQNTLPFDFLTMGELFQNNHHKWGQSPNFAVRGFELDPTYQFMRLMAWLKIIDLSGAQRARWSPPSAAPAPAAPVLPAASAMDGQ